MRKLRYRSAALILLLTACQEGPQSNAGVGDKAALTRPAPGEPEYVAEDPRLARFAGQPGPNVQLQMVDGQAINLKNLYGTKPVYLKLWATYCIPCRAQMPDFDRLYRAHGDRIEVIAVNAGVGDDASKVKIFAQDAKMRMPVAIDDGALGAWIKLRETPLHIVIGRDGRVIHAGHQDGPPLDAAIAKAIAAPNPNNPIAVTDVSRIASLKPGDGIPAIALRDSRDRPVRLKPGAARRPRAILFTSVWCESYLKTTEPQSVPICRRAREEFNRLAKADANAFELLGIVTHLWTDSTTLASYEAEMNPQIPLAVDSDGAAFRTFGIRRLPAIAHIDRDGRLIRVIGPDEIARSGALAAISASNQYSQ